MYGIVLLAALCAGEESAHGGIKYHHPHHHPKPIFDNHGCPGYHNHGGWGLPYGGYAWPGYSCPSLWHIQPEVTIPAVPLVTPPQPKPEEDEDEEDETKNGGTKPKKDGDKPKNGGDKNGGDKPKNGDKKEGEDKEEIGAGPAAANVSRLGLRVTDLTPPRKRYLGYDSDVTGVAVSAVVPRGVADRDGLREGMVIVSVDGVSVRTAKQAADAIDKASVSDGIRLRVLDPLGERRTITLGD